jgi:hypothetical protein
MRRLWVVVGGAVLVLDALILTGKILAPIDALREASVHYESQVIALGFGPFESILVLAAVLLLSSAVVAGERSRLLTVLLRAGVLLGGLVSAVGLYAAVNPPTTGAVGRNAALLGNSGVAGSLSTVGRFVITLPAVGVALIAGLAALIGLRALLRSRSTIVPVRGSSAS